MKIKTEDGKIVDHVCLTVIPEVVQVEQANDAAYSPRTSIEQYDLHMLSKQALHGYVVS
jgi:hypothetical protein